MLIIIDRVFEYDKFFYIKKKSQIFSFDHEMLKKIGIVFYNLNFRYRKYFVFSNNLNRLLKYFDFDFMYRQNLI